MSSILASIVQIIIYGKSFEFFKLLSKRISPAVKGQNCSFFDKSIKFGRVTNLYKTNISWYGAMPNFLPEPWNVHVKNIAYMALTWKRG